MTNSVDELFIDNIRHEDDTREDMLARMARELEGAGFVVVDMRSPRFDSPVFALPMLGRMRRVIWDNWLIPMLLAGYVIFALGWTGGAVQRIESGGHPEVSNSSRD